MSAPSAPSAPRARSAHSSAPPRSAPRSYHSNPESGPRDGCSSAGSASHLRLFRHSLAAAAAIGGSSAPAGTRYGGRVRRDQHSVAAAAARAGAAYAAVIDRLDAATAGSGSRHSGADVAARSAPSTASLLHSCAAARAAASASRSRLDFSPDPDPDPAAAPAAFLFAPPAGVPGRDGC